MAGMSISKLKTFNAGVKGSTLGVSGPQYVMVPKSMPSSCVSRWLPVRLTPFSPN